MICDTWEECTRGREASVGGLGLMEKTESVALPLCYNKTTQGHTDRQYNDVYQYSGEGGCGGIIIIIKVKEVIEIGFTTIANILDATLLHAEEKNQYDFLLLLLLLEVSLSVRYANLTCRKILYHSLTRPYKFI